MASRTPQSILERVLNHCLSLDPYAGPNLESLQGKAIELALADSGLSMSVRFLATGVRVESTSIDFEPDARISGTLPALIKMATEIQQTPPGFGSSVSVTGDIEVVQNLATLLRELDIDWEEQLARWIGDSAAHGFGLVLRAFHGWGRQTSHVLWMDVGEYLSEETRMLPHADEVTTYLERVDEIRDDVERLSARIARLDVPESDLTTGS